MLLVSAWWPLSSARLLLAPTPAVRLLLLTARHGVAHLTLFSVAPTGSVSGVDDAMLRRLPPFCASQPPNTGADQTLPLVASAVYAIQFDSEQRQKGG